MRSSETTSRITKRCPGGSIRCGSSLRRSSPSAISRNGILASTVRIRSFSTRFEPTAARKTLRTTNVIERIHEEFRRRVKTQGSLPSEDAALILLFSLVVSGQIKLRRIDGWRKIAAVLSQHTAVAA